MQAGYDARRDMADTIVDKPAKTMPDVDPEASTAPAERSPIHDRVERAPAPPPPKGNVLAIALSVIAAIVAVAGVAIYLFVIHYNPIARRHVPGNAVVAARAELADLLLFGPVRDHLWPALVGKGSSRVKKIATATGVDLASDVREVVVASTDAKSWVVIFGGKLERGRFLKGFSKVLADEGKPGSTIDGDVLVTPSGAVIAQSDDGALILGTDKAIVRAALPSSDEYKKLDLPIKGAVSFAVTKRAWAGASRSIVITHASALDQVERAKGRFDLGRSPLLTMEIEPAQGVTPKALAADLEAAIAELRIVTLVVPEMAGEKRALGAATIKVDGDRVVLTAPWPYDALDGACKRLATQLD